MSFPKFSDWVSLREEAPTQPPSPSVAPKPNNNNKANIKKKIAQASQGGKFDKAKFVKSLESDPSVDPKDMINAIEN